MIRNISSAHVYRNRLTANFLASYYPDSMPQRDMVWRKLQQWFEPERGAAARAAVDTLLLLYLAKVGNNQSMRHEGIRRHQVALQLLRDALQQPNPTKDESVFGAIDVLGVCDQQFLLPSNSLEAANGAHVHGLQALVLSRGPEVLDSSLVRDVFFNVIHVLVMNSLLARKASVFGQPEWQAHLYSSNGRPGRIAHLVSLACVLPGLLEKADKLLAGKSTTYVQYTNVMAELIGYESQLLTWLVERYSNNPYDQPYRRSTAGVNSGLLEKTGLQHGYPYPIVLEHNSFLDAMAHYNYWSILLILRKTVRQVGSVATEDILTQSGTSPLIQRQRWTDSCAECADAFCQSVPYAFSLNGTPRHIAVQTVCAFLMPLIVPWYLEIGNREKAEWCTQMIRSALEVNPRRDLSFVERAQRGVTTTSYLGWINLAF